LGANRTPRVRSGAAAHDPKQTRPLGIFGSVNELEDGNIR
jgi:hypothetical protein